MRTPAHQRRRPMRKGAEVIEMAIAMNVLLFVSFGLVEFGQYFYIRHCFTSAVRDGGRAAILPAATQAGMTAAITTTLQQANVTYNSSWLTVTDLTTGTTVSDVSLATSGDQLQFTLATPYASLPGAVRPLYTMTGRGIGAGKVVTSTCVMVKE